MSGKGDLYRKVNFSKYDSRFDEINWKKKKKKAYDKDTAKAK